MEVGLIVLEARGVDVREEMRYISDGLAIDVWIEQTERPLILGRSSRCIADGQRKMAAFRGGDCKEPILSRQRGVLGRFPQRNAGAVEAAGFPVGFGHLGVDERQIEMIFQGLENRGGLSQGPN